MLFLTLAHSTSFYCQVGVDGGVIADGWLRDSHSIPSQLQARRRSFFVFFRQHLYAAIVTPYGDKARLSLQTSSITLS